jgi:hypothetical protein
MDEPVADHAPAPPALAAPGRSCAPHVRGAYRQPHTHAGRNWGLLRNADSTRRSATAPTLSPPGSPSRLVHTSLDSASIAAKKGAPILPLWNRVERSVPQRALSPIPPPACRSAWPRSHLVARAGTHRIINVMTKNMLSASLRVQSSRIRKAAFSEVTIWS